MKKLIKIFPLVIVAIGMVNVVKAQQGFGTSTPAPSAVVDMVAGNKGALLPRIALSSTIVASPVTSPADALTVFNTATAGLAPNNVTPGYYYWSVAGSRWVRLLDIATSDINLYKDNGSITALANRTVTVPHSTNLNFSGLGGGSVYTYIESGTIGLYAYDANGVIEISTEGSNSDITLSTAVAGSDVLLQPQTNDKFVGIGTVSPTQKLDIGIGSVRVRDITATHTLAATDKVVIADNAGILKSVDKSVLAVEPWFVQGGELQSNLNADPIYHTGSVAIGIASSASIPAAEVTAHNPKLYIEGNVSTTGSYYTASSVYADYVFEKYFAGKSEINPNYEFKSLNYVRDFIKTKHHLPGVTSIADLRKANNGYTFDMTKLTVQSLEKIEELYLHTIEQKDKIDAQQKEISDMKIRLSHIEKLLTRKVN
ncbi:hypothetical protein [Pedobacter cryotolerans]|uniref:Peptidase S74 domain-containing protein n=1 Tax=Pedobacter cryotolerans TaxID=2571270 RepID=A0A4U1BZX9_9SPHI|nr:hypothetical protein [Pedobacter cryotolerans]TKB98148.1 hypothetical protein FA045_14270 [Pedobacter cryotolerans]